MQHLHDVIGEPIGPNDQQSAAYLRLRRRRRFWTGLLFALLFTAIFLGAVFITRGSWSPTWWQWALVPLFFLWVVGGIAAARFWYFNRPITDEDVAREVQREADRAGKRHKSAHFAPSTDDDFVMNGGDTFVWSGWTGCTGGKPNLLRASGSYADGISGDESGTAWLVTRARPMSRKPQDR
jgi:hypothetical protein